MAYVTATHLLEHVHPKTLVVNDPAGVRNAPEKLFVTHFPELMPRDADHPRQGGDRGVPGGVRRHRHEAAARARRRRGGASSPARIRISARSSTCSPRSSGSPGWCSASCPKVSEGDKRIILIDGEAAGAVNRVPAANDIRSNMVRGGAARPADLSAREREICETIGPELRRRGLLFVGIDVIDGHLTEINVTCPTGIRAIRRLGGPDLAVAIWDAIEAKR